jgi:hypothetical protein
MRAQEPLTKEYKQVKTIVKFGFAALAVGAFFGSTLPVNADQYASQFSNPFTKHGLPVPGAYFNAKEKPANNDCLSAVNTLKETAA